MGDMCLFVIRRGGLLERPASADAITARDIRLTRGVIPALLRFAESGFSIVVMDDLPAEPEDGVTTSASELRALFESQGIMFSDILVCPHDTSESCNCRLPALGLVSEYVGGNRLDRERSAVVGGGEEALAFARNLGVPGFCVGASGATTWRDVAHSILDRPRTAHVSRKTRETAIDVRIDLDRRDSPAANTGLPFFDHMLEQLGKHGGFSLDVRCDGDLEVDEHHTIEDVALALGEAMKSALSDKRGIGRYGFLLPMDETEAKVSLDLGGRSYLVFDGTFPRDNVGGMPTELVPHFFRSFCDALGASLHISVCGENTHHMIEACFKGLARALRQAIRREGDDLPSTKGTL
jgi:imidazoleglycerol-phosphate dehydratase/histidinol-phosphatase